MYGGKMVLRTGRKVYEVIREVLEGKANSVYVCREQEEPDAPYKTIWIVKERRIARALLENADTYCEETFMQSENAGFVFPYVRERPLRKFYLNSIREGFCTRQQVWLALVEQCMVSKLPPAVVYLILSQGQAHAAPDGSIQFGFQLDLSEYDDSICERDNVIACADEILCLLRLEEPVGKGDGARMQAAALLEKKLAREAYQELIQLYRDIRLLGRADSAGRKWRGRLAVSEWDWLYRLLSGICIVLVCLVVLMAAGSLFLGDASFWKLFDGSLDTIGTESLLQ